MSIFGPKIDLESPYATQLKREERYQEIEDKQLARVWEEWTDELDVQVFIADFDPYQLLEYTIHQCALAHEQLKTVTGNGEGRKMATRIIWATFFDKIYDKVTQQAEMLAARRAQAIYELGDL